MRIEPEKITTEDDFNSVFDDLLKENGIEVDENSEEPVVFEYTDLRSQRNDCIWSCSLC